MRYEADCSRSVWIRLDEREVDWALSVGKAMYEKSHEDGRRDALGFRDENGAGLRVQQEGACAELAVAKKLGIYWPARIDQGDKTDLPFGIEVRFLGQENYGLRVRHREADDLRMVGAIPPAGGPVGRWRIPGWCYAIEAREAAWQLAPNGRPPFWAVPQSELRPLFELRCLIAAAMTLQAEREEGALTRA